jgi:hypothetical protein
MKIKLLIEYLGFCLLLFTTQFNKPLYLSKSDYLYELSIAAEAFQRTGQQVFRTVTKNIETNPLDGYPRLDKVQQRHNEIKVFMIAHWDFHIIARAISVKKSKEISLLKWWWPGITNVWWGNPIHCTAENQLQLPNFFGTAIAYFVCSIGPNFQISLIYAFIRCP